MSRFAKKFAAGVSSALMLVSSFAFVGVASAAAHSVGTNVKTADGTIWMITPNNCRAAYTSAGAFTSYGFNSFADVKDANADDLALPTCAQNFIPPQDGQFVFSDRGADKGTGYVISGGKKYGFPTWNIYTTYTKGYTKAPETADLSWMTMGGVINDATLAHLPGAVVDKDGTYLFVDTNGLRGFPTWSIFTGWGYSKGTVVTANAADKAMAQVSVLSDRMPGYLSPTGSGTATPPTTGPVSVSLAADNPAAGTFVAGQALADLAHFTLTGNGTVTALTFERIGVSANTTPANVYLFEGSTRLTDAASFGSDNKATFAGLNWTVSGTRTIAIKADIASSTSGQTVGAKIVSITAGGTASTVSVSGNIHTIATATLATVAIASATGSGNTDPGKDINVWQGTVTVSTRDVTLNRVALRQVGSIIPTDINNFRLFVDGVQVAQTQSLDSNGYVTFAPNTVVKTGARTVKVMADVIGGSGRTVQLSLRGAYDFSTTDSSYGAMVLATGTFPFGPSAFTVNAGALTVAKATDSPSANVVAGASDVSVGKWTFTAYGEPIKVETLTVGIDTNGTDANNSFRNVRIMVDGSQVGSTTSVAAVNSYASGTSFTTNFTVTPGTPRVVEVRSDMVDDTATDLIANGTTTSATFALVAGSSNATPQVSLSMIGVPTASVPANGLTIATGSVSLATTSNYPSQSVVTPQTAYKIGSFTLSGNSSEAVNVNTFTLSMTVTDNTGAPAATVADVTDVYIKYGANQTSVKPTISASGNTWSPSFTLGKNETMQVDVYGTLGSDIQSTDTVQASLLVSGTTASSGQSVSTNSGSVLAGQTITGSTGSITATKDASSPDARLVDDSGTVTTAAFKFAAVTDSYSLTDFTFTLGNASAVSSVALKDGSTTLATKPGSTSLTFSGLNVAVAANTNKVLTVELTLSPVGVGAGTTDSSLLTTLTDFTARNSGGTSAAGTESNPAGNNMYVYKAVPTVSQIALPNADLAAGTNVTIAKFSVNTNGTGTVAWKQILLEISKTATPTISSVALYNADSNTQITAATAFQNGSAGVATTCVGDNTSCELLITVGTNADDDTVETVSGARNYEVRATIGGSIASTDSVSVKLDNNITSHAASAAFQTNKNSGAANNTSFTWSDESASATNDTGVSTWQKDYLIKNLPISWNMN